MNIFKTGIVLSLILLFFGSCSFLSKSKKGSKDASSVSANTKNLTEIIFGSGGGFTGMVDEYHLAVDGTLRQKDSIIKKINSKQMKALFDSLLKVNFPKLKINDPGNMYYFIEIRSVNKDIRITWNDMTALPPEVKSAYDTLMGLMKQ